MSESVAAPMRISPSVTIQCVTGVRMRNATTSPGAIPSSVSRPAIRATSSRTLA
ncbi:MAG: hypothetical protein R3D59_05495 [Paracoccaceae bacterium]